MRLPPVKTTHEVLCFCLFVCLSVLLPQVGSTCSECGIVFGRYFCSVCNLFDDEEKGQFHCQDCGICR